MVSDHVITSAVTSGETEHTHIANVFSRSVDLLSVFFFYFYFAVCVIRTAINAYIMS